MLQHRCFEGFNIKPGGDFLQSRIPVLVNSDCHIVLAAPKEWNRKLFYKNTDGDEMIFVHEGSGVVKHNTANCLSVTVIILFYRGELFIKLNLLLKITGCLSLNLFLRCATPNVT